MTDIPTAHGFAINQGSSQSVRDVLIGRIFNNRFRIQSLVARGGMGRVYHAVQIPLGREVALKVLNTPPTAEHSADFNRRFFLEAAIAARLAHPHTVTVFDYGRSDDGIYYIAMELLKGVSLRAALLRARVFTPRRALSIATQIAGALREAHELGAVHRDLKPANVFLIDRGTTHEFVKVLDFGLVKNLTDPNDGLTKPGRFLGSPGYMAPEQIRAQHVDHRCDIYALGVVLYEMLAGTPPFVRTNSLETMRAHVHDAVPPLTTSNARLRVPTRLLELVHACLAKDPADRPASLDEVISVFAELTGQTVDSHVEIASPQKAPISVQRRTPVRLDEAEESGWSVVSSTGILAIPRSKTHAAAARQADNSDDPIETVAMAAALPTVPKNSRLPSLALSAAPSRRWRARSMWIAAVVLAASFFGLQTVQRNQRPDFMLRLNSRPQGAAVYLGGTLICAATPCEQQWDRTEAPLGKRLNLRFVRDGYDEFVASRVVVDQQLTVTGTLYPTTRREPQ